jgi:hypothetical protein
MPVPQCQAHDRGIKCERLAIPGKRFCEKHLKEMMLKMAKPKLVKKPKPLPDAPASG